MFCRPKVPARSLFICTLVLALIAALIAWKSEYLVIRQIKDPVKLFQNSSIVTDYEFGRPSNSWHELTHQDITLIYFYATWDPQSLRFKDDYESLAHEYDGRIKFIALNCWHPRSHCFSKGQRTSFYYPNLQAYVKGIAIEYIGPLTREYLSRFLDNLVKPIQLLHNYNDLSDLRLRHDAILMKRFNFTERSYYPPGFLNFWRASVKALNSDPFRRIKFVFAINDHLRDFGLKLRIHDQNSTIVHYMNSTTTLPVETEDDLLRLLVSKLVENAFWFTPDGNKDSQLSKLMNNQSVLLLFTPRMFGKEHLNPHVAMKMVAMHYRMCNENGPNKIAKSTLKRALEILPESMVGQHVDLNVLNCHCASCLGNHENRTLKFMAMDSQLYEAFADQLGVKLPKFGVDYMTRAVILMNDNVFVNPYNNSIEGYANFILDWHAKRCERHLKSDDSVFEANPGQFNLGVVNGTFRVREINGAQFTSEVLEDYNHNVIVYHYAPFCIMCHTVNHVFLQVAYDLKDNDDFKFVRLNSHTNDLPQAYEPTQYPTIVLWPKTSERSRGRIVYDNHEVLSLDFRLLGDNICNLSVGSRLESSGRYLAPVLMSHGIFEASALWLYQSEGIRPRNYASTSALLVNQSIEQLQQLAGPDQSSLAFLLSNTGYDVFLLNMRGTDLSLGHRNLSSSDSKYWDFAADELGLIDVRETLEFIRELTDTSKIGYAGHLLGTFTVTTLLAEHPKYADLIEPVISVAQVSYVASLNSPTVKQLFEFYASRSKVVEGKESLFGAFQPASGTIRKMLGKLCYGHKFTRSSVCRIFVELLGGVTEKSMAQRSQSSLVLITMEQFPYKKLPQHFT
ncbi:Thioredoxin domain-containing protein 11 [Fragariocoptes setiger]|uniref:Thioredoxin domain-containing protein 11 n=1 Tax=Fragariocoptes setiger TaxID=1670756 RepID=A0ABQ7S7S8_9ACAR|nr:Thioredoxin domain-containing protein 11 [Fragariocoptes setiger]